MSKTNKELAVELLGQYINARTRRIDDSSSLDNYGISDNELTDLLEMFYEAVKTLPDD